MGCRATLFFSNVHFTSFFLNFQVSIHWDLVALDPADLKLPVILAYFTEKYKGKLGNNEHENKKELVQR